MQLEPENMVVLALWIVLLLMISLYIYQTFRKNRQAHLLTLALILGLVGLSLWAFRPFLPDFLSSKTSVLANGFAYIFMYFAIYLHFEQVYRLRPHLARLSIMSIFVGIGIGTTFVLLATSSTPQLVMVNDFAHDAIRLSAFVFGGLIFLRSWLMTREREGMIEWVSLTILAVGGIPPILGNFFSIRSIGDMSVYEVGDIITFVGLVLLIGVYLSNPNYLYRLPTPMFRIILFNSTGIAVYSRAIQSRGFEGITIPDQLMSMSIAAISSVLSESLQTNAQLLKVEISGRMLMFEWRENLSAMLVCERGTYFARRSLRMLLQSFPDELFEILRSDTIKIDSGLLETLDSYVKASFPYLVFLRDDEIVKSFKEIEARDVD